MSNERGDASLANADVLEAGLAAANIPTLLCVLVQLTGDLSWLEPPFRPQPTRGFDENDSGGLSADLQDHVRRAAHQAISEWLAGRPIAIPDPDPGLLVQMLSATSAEEIPDEYGPMIAAELASSSEASASPALTSPGLKVLIVGGGFSGILAAVELARAGVPYLLVERSPRLGGVWRDNTYPGAGVDTPSHLYEYSFAPNDWPHFFSNQEEVLRYLERTADQFGIRQNVRLQTEVRSARFDNDRLAWNVDLVGPDGVEEHLRVPFLISAVGAFNRPKRPFVPGADDFGGTQFHTAEWPSEFEPANLRIAVIGNGASAMQCVPRIAETAAQVTIFQRSSHWIAPFHKFKQEVPEPLRKLMADVEPYRRWYRIRLSWIYNDRLHATLQRDPQWAHPERSINAINDRHRDYFTRYIERELEDRPDLIEAVTPPYPPYGKRMLMDNGWYRTLRRPNVRLVTDPISRIGEEAIETATGDQVPVDAIIWATGFDVVMFMSTLDLYGKHGRTLRESWPPSDARAYLGSAVPDFPNLFILYGPNLQPGHGGSLIPAVEAQMHLIMRLLDLACRDGVGSIEVTREAYESYNERVDDAHSRMVWSHEGMNTYVRNEAGRVIVNSPFRVVDYWHFTRAVEKADFAVNGTSGDRD